jgi:anti-anti-sigma factor
MTAVLPAMRELEGVFVVRLGAEIDMTNASALRLALGERVPNDAIGLVVDLSETTYFDSAGVHMLFDLADQLGVRQQRIAVALPPRSPIRRVLQVVRLEERIPMADSVRAAIAEIRSGI